MAARPVIIRWFIILAALYVLLVAVGLIGKGFRQVLAVVRQ